MSKDSGHFYSLRSSSTVDKATNMSERRSFVHESSVVSGTCSKQTARLSLSPSPSLPLFSPLFPSPHLHSSHRLWLIAGCKFSSSSPPWVTESSYSLRRDTERCSPNIHKSLLSFSGVRETLFNLFTYDFTFLLITCSPNVCYLLCFHGLYLCYVPHSVWVRSCGLQQNVMPMKIIWIE